MLTGRELIMAIVDNDCFEGADAAILLEGDGFFRYKRAVELYNRGLVSKIVFSGNIDDREYGSIAYEEILPLMLDAGAQADDIIHERASTNTREQAVCVVKLASEMGWKSLALVASPDHQYRAYLTFLREVIDTGDRIALYNTPARGLDWFVDSGWGTRVERIASEFERIERYMAAGHLARVEEVIEYQSWKESLRYE